MKIATPKRVNLRLIDYGSDERGLLNALLYEPNSVSRADSRQFAIITLHGSEGHAMSGINLWLSPYLATRGYSVVCPNKRNSVKSYYTPCSIGAKPTLPD